ncbi:hypothetical protein BCR32DRAFT_324860 [Anaeromyces robustus]|uniref:Uncharacterized protein n=1 Tax=Anaeromyces robustus TaxID=1754192 RepID=A0A1Y1XLP7_9FUNG|nr:hypothetical protein BCR32DRAFT_324860 [Anaeromyces robustus]|eukprot:ORX86662.1 hypothetical protein BCR32DRAFT_324860 [Anaeromyces robustus]
MTSTLKSPLSLRNPRKDSHYYSYLARKKRSFEEENFEILTDNYRKNKRFITEIMVQQFSLLTVSKSEKVRHLHQETNNKMNYGEHRFRRKPSKIKTCNTILNSPLSQPPIIISFNNSEIQEPTPIQKINENNQPSLNGYTTTTETKKDNIPLLMSNEPITPIETLESSMEECI